MRGRVNISPLHDGGETPHQERRVFSSDEVEISAQDLAHCTGRVHGLSGFVEPPDPLGLWSPRRQPRVWGDDDGDAAWLDERRESVEEEHGVGESADEVGGKDGVELGEVGGQMAGVTLTCEEVGGAELTQRRRRVRNQENMAE